MVEECFHMTSRRPYWCPKTMKWRPKPFLWELNSFLMQTPSFVPINLHRCWPREWNEEWRHKGFNKSALSEVVDQIVVLWWTLMAAYNVFFSRLWGFYVTNSVVTGYLIASINPDNTSLLYAWLVSLCDLVYITDALARIGKRLYRTVITANLALLNRRSHLTSYEMFVILLKCLTLVPYHAMVIKELDDSWIYLALCALRIAVLLSSGRFYVMKAILKTREQRQVKAAEKGVRPRDKKNQNVYCSKQVNQTQIPDYNNNHQNRSKGSKIVEE